jgi:HAD superfamily hydrolase (TIGR01484 family)
MRPIRDISAAEIAPIRYVLTDIDDTLTVDGRLVPEAFEALWLLSDRGFKVIPVTGRPAGWCDCIVRQWPVSAVVGENGAFAYYLEKGRRRELLHTSVRFDVGYRLDALRDRILREVPGARVAGDQPFRRFDLALDFAEEEPHLGMDIVTRIVGIYREEGAEAKISSIHVNAWFGSYDKVSMSLMALETLFRERNPVSHVLFCGDSPNDEPMFALFPCSCGVANISRFAPLMKRLPAFLTEAVGGRGFRELVDRLIALTE